MRWISNTYNPDSPYAFIYGPTPIAGQSQEEAYRDWKYWLSNKIIGLPQAMEKYTVEQLVKMDMVGVYEP